MVPVTAWTLRKTARIFSRLLQPRAWGSAIAEKHVSVDRNRNGAFQRSSISRNPLNFAKPDAPRMEYLPTFPQNIAQFCRSIFQHHGSHLGKHRGVSSTLTSNFWSFLWY